MYKDAVIFGFFKVIIFIFKNFPIDCLNLYRFHVLNFEINFALMLQTWRSLDAKNVVSLQITFCCAFIHNDLMSV
jgi:hypothetical protein